MLLLLAGSNLLLAAFPVRVEVRGGDAEAMVTVDGGTHYLSLTSPLRAVRFVPAEPYRREYQIDGSDSTNNFNWDPTYFSGFAASPYYRFQALLRDEDSYSRWRNAVIRDGDGRLVARGSEPAEGVEVMVPQPFHLSVELHRLEVPRTLEFVDEDGSLFQVEINRNDRYVRITEFPWGGPPRELTSAYFPRDWLPPAAGVAYLGMRTVALALALVLLLVPLAAVIPRGLAWQPGRRATAAVPLLAAAAVLATGSYSALVLFDGAPHILDAVSYYFQGKVLALGALSAPAPPVREAFPNPFTVVHEGRWFSQYPPGAPLALAIGFLSRVPWLVEPLLAAAATLLVYGIGRRQFGAGTGLTAAVLMASSPFLALQAGSFMSHVPAMFFAACLLYAVTRYLEAPSRRWTLAAGLALGALFLTREGAAVLVGLPVGAYLAVKACQHNWPRARFDLALATAGAAAFGAVYLLYNWALTGSPLLPPRVLFFAGDRFGFGSGVGFYGEHTLAAGLVNADELLTSLTFYLFGWPFYFTLAVIVLPFLLGRTTAWDRVHGALVGLFVVAYVGYFYHGIALGPRYYFEALPSLVLLTARGFGALAAATASILGSLTGRKEWSRARTAVLGLAALLLACNFLYFTPRQVELYRGYSGLPGSRGPLLGDFVQRDIQGRVSTVQGALVTTDDWWIYSVYLAAMNSPRLEGNTVFALMPQGEDGEQLKAAFAGRSWYKLVQDGNGKLILEWQGYLAAVGKPREL